MYEKLVLREVQLPCVTCHATSHGYSRRPLKGKVKITSFNESRSLMQKHNPALFGVRFGDIGNINEQGKWLSAPGGRGQGCAQQHRRETVHKEEKRFHPPKNKSATA